MPISRLLPLVVALSVVGCSQDPTGGDTLLTIRVLSGNHQSALQGDLLPQPVVIEVRDADARGVAGVTVELQRTAGDGRVETAERQTGADGTLALRWRMGDALEHALRFSIRDGAASPVLARARADFRYERPLAQADGWPTAEMASGAGLESIIRGVDEIRDGTYPEIHSLLLVKGGELVFETYFSGHDSNGNLTEWDRTIPHEAQSATKAFRSAMMGIAIDRGFVSGVDQPIYTLFPEHAALFTGTKRDITVEDILTMSSGLAWDESTGDPSANTLSRMYSMPAAQWSEYVYSRPMQFTPGAQWVYNTGASISLNRMIQNASGASMATFVGTYYSSLVESPTLPGIGYPLGAAILPRDMAKLGQVFLDDGMWKSMRIVSQAWVEQSTQARFPINASTGYAYQWWTRRYTPASGAIDGFYAAGNGGQYIIVINDLDLVAVFTGGNFGSSRAGQVHTLLQQYVLPAFVGG